MNVTHFQPKRARLAALLTLLLFAAGMTKLQAQNITFDDPFVKALCVDPETEWDTNHDGELSYEEAAAVTDLDTVFRFKTSITSFDELQYFTGLNAIGSYAFFNCENLTSVVFPDSIQTIGDYAFTGCRSLTSLKLPSTLTYIGDYGFVNCSGLQSITVLAQTPPQLGLDPFLGVTKYIPVLTPCGSSVHYYGNGIGWAGFTNFQGLGGNCRIVFADAKVEALCINKWGRTDINTLPHDSAAAVTDLESVFKGNTEITSFNELQYFTGLTAIGDSAFYGCTSLSSIMIPDNVTTIGSSAFDHCNSLSSIKIPVAVDSIAKKAFSSCPSLASMRVASGNATYDSRNRCNAIIETATNTLVAGCITTVIPIDIVSIGDYAFHGLTGLTSVVFPNSLTSIGEGAFGGCTDLTSVTIPANVTFIRKEAFAQCTGLESITVHATTPPALGADAFADVDISNIPVYIPANTLAYYQAAPGWSEFTNLVDGSTPITFADANVKAICVDNWGSNGELTYTQAALVTDLGEFFKSNTSITSFNELQYFTGLTSLGDSVFHGCQNLASVRIPNGVTSIGTGAFSDCGSLASIEIPNAVTAIGTVAFSGCSSLTSMSVVSDNRIYDSRNDCNAIIETATNTLVAGCKNTVIPYTITTIADRAFYGCTGLTSFVVPHPVAYIGAYAFYQCSNLTTLQLLCPLTSIGDYAFAHCASIGSLTLEATTPPDLGTDVFQGVDTFIPVYIPYGTYSDYRTAPGWSSFTNLIDPANIVFADPVVKALCVANWDTNEDGELSLDEAAAVTSLKRPFLNQSVFQDNRVITSFDELQYFTGLTSIMDDAFEHCENLTSIIIPNGVILIGSYAFYGCIKLTSFEIPSHVGFIGMSAFAYCNRLASLTVWATTPPTLNGAMAGVFEGVSPSIPVYVPCAALDGYRSQGWGGFSNFVGSGGTCLISFADANVKAICVATETGWDTNVDGELSYDEAAAVTNLGTVFKEKNNITSFDELQYFTGLISIGDEAFEHCVNLTSVTLPASVTFIGESAFDFCHNLTSVVIPNSSVAVIGDYAFHQCQSLSSIAIPNTVTTIGVGAFYDCSLLNPIVIPNSVISIGTNAFGRCLGITSMVVASDNPVYDSREGCNAIINTATNTLLFGCKNTVIPQSITTIGDYAFKGLSNMESLTVWATTPPALGTEVFDGVNTSIPVYIPHGTRNNYLGTEGWNRFNYFVERSYISFVDDNVKNICVENWGSNGQLSYEEAAAVTDLNGVFWSQPITSFNELQYFTGLDTIGNREFQNCRNLTSVRIPNSVTSIGDGAFNCCEKLTSIEIPNLVTAIGEGAFMNCDSLASMTVAVGNPKYDSPDDCNAIIETATNTLVAGCRNTVIPNTVTSIGNCALSITSLGSIEIPASVTFIGGYAFSTLYSLTVHATTPPALGQDAFIGVSRDIPVYIPTGTLAAYQAAEGWGSYFTNFVEFGNLIIFADNIVKAICVTNWDTDGDGELSYDEAAAVTDLGTVFRYNTSITSFDELQHFTGLTSIGIQEFRQCVNLTSVSLPNSVTIIEDLAFGFCFELTSIEIPNSVITIGKNVFSSCSALASMTVDEDNPVYDSREGCNAIIETATNTLVAGCKNTVIPNTVTSIGEDAFGITNLSSIEIPASVTFIGKEAFNGLDSLTVHATTPPILGPNAFNFSSKSFPVYIPAGTLDAYQSYSYGGHLGWGGFTNFVEMDCEYDLSIEGHSTGTGGWNLIASPLVTDVAPADVDNMLNDVYDLYRFDGSCQGAEWRNFKNSDNNGFTTLSFGHGYLYANSNNVTLQFVGPKSVADSDRSVIVLSRGQVNAMEGIFVEYSATLEEVTFTKATRGARAFGSPMVNIDLRDAEGRLLDRARLRTGEGASMGKLDLMSDPNRLYFRLDDEDYAMVRVNGEGEMPLNFDAAQDGSFTLSVKVEGMDMGYLHLVDNMTGADVDLLATSTGSEATYSFTAKTTDYASRFRLVFSEDGGSSTGSAATNFAYISNGNIVITNAGANAMLQVIDVMGRVIVSVGGHTRCIITSGIPAGVYVLRLVSGDDVKVQKIIIE